MLPEPQVTQQERRGAGAGPQRTGASRSPSGHSGQGCNDWNSCSGTLGSHVCALGLWVLVRKAVLPLLRGGPRGNVWVFFTATRVQFHRAGLAGHTASSTQAASPAGSAGRQVPWVAQSLSLAALERLGTSARTLEQVPVVLYPRPSRKVPGWTRLLWGRLWRSLPEPQGSHGPEGPPEWRGAQGGGQAGRAWP